jgi:hypothetical protein
MEHELARGDSALLGRFACANVVAFNVQPALFSRRESNGDVLQLGRVIFVAVMFNLC